MPWQAWDVCESLAQLWNITSEDVEALMLSNLQTLCGNV
jgi:hypothetical protein